MLHTGYHNIRFVWYKLNWLIENWTFIYKSRLKQYETLSYVVTVPFDSLDYKRFLVDEYEMVTTWALLGEVLRYDRWEWSQVNRPILTNSLEIDHDDCQERPRRGRPDRIYCLSNLSIAYLAPKVKLWNGTSIVLKDFQCFKRDLLAIKQYNQAAELNGYTISFMTNFLWAHKSRIVTIFLLTDD